MKKVLIIDDDIIVAQTYSLKLRAEGFETEIARDGASGLTQILSGKPDLVILDLMLPDMSGLDVLFTLRSDEAFSKMPVLMLSNHYLEVGEEALSGLSRSLVKAETTPSKVIEVIREMLALNDRKPPNPLQRVRDRFCSDVVSVISPMRLALHSLKRSPGEAPEAYRIIKGHAETITAAAAEIALSRISHLTSALAGLAQQLAEHPENATSSTSRSIAGALDALDRLAQAGIKAENLMAPLGLVVEDELVSQTIVRTALNRSRIRSIVTDSGEFALQLLEGNTFDVIFLDVTLPGIDGYQVCTALRKIPAHQTTPVIFITALKEFEARTRSILSGANDVIAKPASVTELAVKALTHLIKA